MSVIEKVVHKLSSIGRWIAIVTMTIMMLFTTIAVISRNFGMPIVGDVEIMQLGMIVLIMFALAYTQKEEAHISIGLLVDRMPLKFQHFVDFVSYLITFVICLIIGWVSFNKGLGSMSGNVKSTDLLSVPHYPFRFIITLGFLLWALEAFLKSSKALLALSARKER